MKSVLISTQPRWCKLIASGKKRIEVRKTKPKIEVPFKCYIYCTKDGKNLIKGDISTTIDFVAVNGGKVIGEFVCDEIFPIRVFENGGIQDYMFHRMERSCVPYGEIANYIGNDKTGCGWHISNLVIYDKPMELSEFRSYNCRAYIDENSYPMPTHEITRPPQSWCYVKKGADHEQKDRSI